MIYIANKRRKEESIRKQYPKAVILDVTSKAEWAQQLSPFYPHGGIPIPNSNGKTAMSVEGIWQGLKVFENEDISFPHFQNTTMKGLKRTVRKLGKPLGHRYGIDSKELLSYMEARVAIYLPTYKWILENIPSIKHLLTRISEKAQETDIVFLDYNTNNDFRNLKTPLSHAALIKMYIEGQYPHITLDDLRNENRGSDTIDKDIWEPGILPFKWEEE